MNKIKTIAMALLCATAFVGLANAADSGTEFGIDDDLSVFGTGGTAVDPDVEIKGFSVFGATQAAPSLNIPAAPGNIFVNGYVQISSGLYVAGSSTFTSTVYLPAPTSLYITGGSNGQVMTKNTGTGAMQWSDVSSLVSGDNLGNHIATTTLNMSGFDVKTAGYITASSEAISGLMVVYGTSTLTGNVGMGGTLGVAGDVNMAGKLNVAGASTFVSSMTVLGNTQQGDNVTDRHAVNMAVASDTAFAVAGQSVSGEYIAKFYSGANVAAWIRKK